MTMLYQLLKPNYCLLITVFLLGLNTTGYSQQKKLLITFSNIHQATYDLNKAIKLSSIGGDLHRAKKHFAQMDERKPQYHLAQACSQYNLYGKAKAYEYLKQETDMSKEEIAYTKVLLADYTKNYIDKYALHQTFKNQYPSSKFLLYLDLMPDTVQRSASEWDEIQLRRKQLIARIDRRLSVEKDSEKRLFLELKKLDIGNYATPIEQQQLTLCRLWKEYREFINTDYLTKVISNCQLPECLQTLETIRGKRGQAPEQEIFDILDNFNPDESTILEERLLQLIADQTNISDTERLRAMVFAASDEMEMPISGIEGMLIDGFGAIKFSETLMDQVQPTLPKGALINLVIGLPLIGKLPNEVRTQMYTASQKQVYYGLGYIQNAQFWADNLENNLDLFVTAGPSDSEKENWGSMQAFLNQNPFYYKEKSLIFSFDYPPTDTKEQLLQAIDVLRELKVKYPGSLALHKTQHMLLIFNWGLMKDDQVNYYRSLFQSVFDLFAANQNYGDPRNLVTYFDVGTNDSLRDVDFVEGISSALSPKLKKDLKQQLEKLKEENPLHNNLKELDQFFK